MKSIKDIIKEKEKTIFLKGFDPVASGGFTQVPNVLLENKKISATAKLCYAMLLKYAWYKNYVFPGQGTLAKEMGTSRPTVIKALKELERVGYLEQKRRGQGKTNVYILHCRVNIKK